jgi:ABC-type transport system involved in multi-copper enzyme maturation permease subunit
MSEAVAVARYTVLEMSRRRLLLAIVALDILLTVAIGVTPHLMPGNDTDTKRLVVVLSGLVTVVPDAVLLCSLAVGMTVINHDLESGAAVSIFAKPVTRASYTLGKLLAGAAMLILIVAIFTAGSLTIAAFNGGQVYGVMLWSGAALAANSILLMLLVMTLTVYVNNVIAAGIVLAFNYAASNVQTLHAMVQHNVLTNQVGRAIVETAYWAVPHELTSDLQRQIEQMRLASGVDRYMGAGNPMAGIPGPSGAADIAFWLAYVVGISVVLFWAVRRKQV